MSGPTSPRAYLREQAGLAGSHFLSLDGYDAKALTALLDLSAEWKEWRRAGGLQNKANVHTRQPLLSRSVATLFEKKSTRTRVSVETACSLLGGHALFLGKDDIHLGKGESLRDTGNVLGRMNDVIFARVYAHSTLTELAKYANTPVVNGLSELTHPMQALADLLTMREHFGKLEGLTLAWVGDGNNIIHSLLNSCPQLGINVQVCTPTKYPCKPDILASAQARAQASGSRVESTHDPLVAVKGANVIVTDTWISMGDEAQREERLQEFAGYQVSMEMMKAAPAADNWVFMHCLPRHEEEVSDEVFYSDRSLVFQEAGNRLYTAMAVFDALIPDQPNI
eukprot:TRINITY_DN549_c0_g1_i14.p1 TRINITY_DN549_c0_g1~~TRINITY_DN549_c0_g1_i14.p1  ORF type:complete len:338 (+),score=65.11 TRINITY_DN549_c0_g1_i14:132-1145(+)